MKVEYKRDMNCNYLTLSSEDNTEIREDISTVITENKLRNVLNCQIRFLNGHPVYYYDISSKQPLCRLYENREMEYKALKALLLSIKNAMESMSEFFLDMTGFLAEPEFIYIDSETGEASFVVYPQYDRNTYTTIPILSEYLLEKICHSDREAVEIGYELFRITREDNFVLTGLFDSLIAQGGGKPEVKVTDAYDDTNLRESCYEMNALQVSEEVMKNQPVFDYEAVNSSLDVGESLSSNPKVTKRNRKRYISMLLIIVALLMIAVFWFLCNSSSSFTGAKVGILSVGVLLLVIAFLSTRKSSNRIATGSVGTDSKSNDYGTADSEWKTSTSNEKTNAFNKKNNVSDGKSVAFAEKSIVIGEESIVNSNMHYGATMVIGVGNSEQRMLYCTIHGKNEEYPLSKLPVTIGKMKEHSDIVLDDRTISRMHARIYEKDGKVFLEDLNSTNGTFKNGVRLEANETVELETGDELQFGRVDAYYQA